MFLPYENNEVRVRVTGPYACFTRPEAKVERVSYECMTPSAAKGILEAISWHPTMHYEVKWIAVLAPIQWASFQRNEVSYRGGKLGTHLCVDDRKNRTQRNTLALKNVDYIIAATVHINHEHHDSDNVFKFVNMLRTRTKKGQCYRQPALGMREFAADFTTPPHEFTPIDPSVSRPLGAMNYGVEYLSNGISTLPMFFDARLEGGIMHVPSWNNVAKTNGIRLRDMRTVAC